MSLTIHMDLYRQTLEGVYFPHHCAPLSLAVIFPTVGNFSLPQKEVLIRLWQLLRSPEPKVTPGRLVDIRNAAFHPNILPREDP